MALKAKLDLRLKIWNKVTTFYWYIDKCTCSCVIVFLFLRLSMRNKLFENRAMTWRIYLAGRVKRRVIVLMTVSPKGARHATSGRCQKRLKKREDKTSREEEKDV